MWLIGHPQETKAHSMVDHKRQKEGKSVENLVKDIVTRFFSHVRKKEVYFI